MLDLLAQPEQAVEQVPIAETSQGLVTVYGVSQRDRYTRVAIRELRDRRNAYLRYLGELLPNHILD
ncbi:hypothetical protein D3C84_1268380 [compost metagenome]